MAAHIPLDTQNNGTGRSILGYYVGFSEDHRGGILVFNPKTRTTNVRHTYKAEPCQQVLDDANYIFAPPVSATQRRANKAHTVATRGVTDKAMEYAQAMAHPEAPGLKAALVDELKSLSPNEHWEAFLGKETDIPKGRLIYSKAIFSIVYNPDGTFKKYKARLVARGDILQSKSKDTYSSTVSSQATRLLLGIIAEHDLDLRSFDAKTAFLYNRLNEFSASICVVLKGSLTPRCLPLSGC